MTYTYDSNGNTLSKATKTGTTTYTWDFENRMASTTPAAGTVVNLKYDPFGRRMQEVSSSGDKYLRVRWANLTEEVGSTRAVVARHTQGPGIDEPLAMLRGTTTADYYEADGLGSVTSLTGSTGSVATGYTYDSLGTWPPPRECLPIPNRKLDSQTSL